MSEERIKKLNDLLRDEAGRIIAEKIEAEDGVLVTVTGADTSPTLEHATIRISVFPQDKANEIIKKIGRRIYHIQQLLNKKLIMRPVPKIRFEIDRTEEQAGKIDGLFKNL